MYVKEGSVPGTLDAVAAVEGTFILRPGLDIVPTIEVKMVYLSSITKTTFGTCPAAIFKQDTTEMLLQFIKLAERDFGEVVFHRGYPTSFDRPGPPVGQGAEGTEGLNLPASKGLGGS